MSITGIIQDGKVELPPDAGWPSGTLVRVEKIEPSSLSPSSIADSLGEFIGMADDLPSDLARNLNHYIHGHPKR